ncbi:YAP1-binding protein 1 [Xanthoria calcicola]
MSNNDNPLIKALPPAVDYLSYLTILEYHLTLEQLPLLHDILQDTTLTANIGWDLVHLLLPLLPQSQQCLHDVARLGNPREVVLKVTELLEAIGTPDEETNEEEAEDDLDETDGYEGPEGSRPDNSPLGTAVTSEKNASTADPTQAKDLTSREVPSKVSQFSALLDMLAILHPRIKTRYPSRFLSTSLQAILPAYATLVLDTQATEAVLNFINTFAGTKRPRLPPRKSSTHVPTKAVQLPPAASDPEATGESLAPEETALNERLLQSFLTFVAEGYMSSLPVNDNAPALSWSTRLLEHLHPEKNIPGRRTICTAFEEDEALHRRDSTIGQMLAFTRDLNLALEDLRCSLFESDTVANDDSTDLPASASEVSLSRPGCLYLLCASYASAVLFRAPSTQLRGPSKSTFFSLLGDFFGDPSSSTLGSESLSLIDSLLFFGHYTLQGDDLRSFLERPENDSVFTKTLQYFSIISANTPSAALRYAAHLLTSKILHAHPNDQLRLSFIKDTLQHCPYENLKGSAVGWLKDEILAANPPRISNAASQPSKDVNIEKMDSSIFATPACIATLAPHLFISPNSITTKDEFKAHEGFFLAALNFYYLLLCNEALKEKLDLRGAMRQVEELKVDGGWLGSMEKGLRRFGDGGVDGEDGDMANVKQMNLLEGMIALCKEKEK